MAVTHFESRVWRWPASGVLPRSWFVFLTLMDEDDEVAVWFYVSSKNAYQRV